MLEARLLGKMDCGIKDQVSTPNVLIVHESGKRTDEMSTASAQAKSTDTQELARVPGDQTFNSVDLDGFSEFRVGEGTIHSHTASAKFVAGFQKKIAWIFSLSVMQSK